MPDITYIDPKCFQKSSYGAVVAQQIANLLVLSSNLSASSFFAHSSVLFVAMEY